MKNRLIVTAFLLTMFCEGAVLEKDSLMSHRINIKSKTGEMKGYMKKDGIDPNRINIYDKYGNQKGFLTKDSLNPDKFELRH